MRELLPLLMNSTRRTRLAPRRSSARSRCRTLPRGDFSRRRCMRRLVASVCLLLIAAVIGGLPVYVRPQIDRLRHADAILILGGEGDSRYLVGLDLGLKGWAPNLVVSNPHWGEGRMADGLLCRPAPPARPALLCPGSADHERRRAGTAPPRFAVRVAHGHRRHVPATHFEGPVHPGALLRR